MDINEKNIKRLYPDFQDSRLNPTDRKRRDVSGPGGMRMHRCYCINCGKEGKLSFPDTTVISYVCQKCYEAGYGLPIPEVPPEALTELFGAK